MAFNLGALAGGIAEGYESGQALHERRLEREERRRKRDATRQALDLYAAGPQTQYGYTAPEGDQQAAMLAEQTGDMFTGDPIYENIRKSEENLFKSLGGEVSSKTAHRKFREDVMGAIADIGDAELYLKYKEKIDEDFQKKAQEYAYSGLTAAEAGDVQGMIRAVENYYNLIDDGTRFEFRIKEDAPGGPAFVAIPVNEETGEPIPGATPQIHNAQTMAGIFKTAMSPEAFYKLQEATSKGKLREAQTEEARAKAGWYRRRKDTSGSGSQTQASRDFEYARKLYDSAITSGNAELATQAEMMMEDAWKRMGYSATWGAIPGPKGEPQPKPDKSGIVSRILSGLGNIGVTDTSGSSEPLMRSGYGEPAIPTPQDRAVPAQASPFNIDYTAKVERALDQGANINDIWALAKTPAQRQIIKRIALERNLYKGQN